MNLKKVKITFLLMIGLIGIYELFHFLVAIPSSAQLTFSQQQTSCEHQSSPMQISTDKPFRIFVWNIYKQQKQTALKQLTSHLNQNDFIVLQESVARPDLLDIFKSNHFFVEQVNAFSLWGETFGVLTASRFQPRLACAFKADEPIIQIPKSALLTQYELTDGRLLSLINLHSINFTFDLSAYQEQIQILLNQLTHVHGPLIIAGDFNSWSEERLQILKKLFSPLDLKAVYFEKDARLRVFGHALDHIYYRDLNLIQSDSVATDGSDHAWMSAKFDFDIK